jgi:hypothetical protein
MINQTEGLIYLADQRAIYQLGNWYQSYNLFQANFEKDVLKSAGLYAFRDESLQAQHSIVVKVEKSSLCAVLPLVGTLDICLDNTQLISLEVGQLFIFKITQGSDYQINNPYEEGIINYVSFQLPFPETATDFTPQLIPLDLATKPNILQNLAINNLKKDLLHNIFIGKFGGREEGIFIPQNPNNEVLSFVIAGVFEVQNRLVQPRDALVLWNINQIEFEALSEEAIILMIEFFA